ncbi:hypothetical protein [Micromonospora humidisoli]|uniref:MYXO-CTERM domain-containing protein n=1 Tax=Micromonospora humidisoli TaxID=2807622 RepID=A0ABS2JBI9_9ACTN|nr:hypothetical protein [Micromonospora humidisoli]MBM7083724.1 hypothetical protein [Micromonospora humidisoli]
MRRAGTATTTGRWLRLLLLVGTLLGLSAMHTLGHDGHLGGVHHPTGHGTSTDDPHRPAAGHDTDRSSVSGPAADLMHLIPAVWGVPVGPGWGVAVPDPAVRSCGDGCPVALPAGPSGTPVTAWSVCLAVLGALTVLVLVLLFVVRTRPAGVFRPPSRPRQPRAPPPRPLGLRLATVSVLRR